MAGIFSDPILVKKINYIGISDCSDLYSSHKEADSRIILHALYVDKMFGLKDTKERIKIKSPAYSGNLFFPTLRTSKSFGSIPDR